MPQTLCIIRREELKEQVLALLLTNLITQQINYLTSLNLLFSSKIKIPALFLSDSREEQIKWYMKILYILKIQDYDGPDSQLQTAPTAR